VVAVTAKPPGTAPNFSRLLSRWLFLLVILVIEFIGIIYQFEAPTVADDASWSARLFANSREIWRIAIGFISVFLISFIPRVSRVKNIISELQEQSTGYRWWLWLTGHFLALAAFIFITSLVFEKPTDPARLSAAWVAGWFALASATFLLWLLAVAPSRFWLRRAREEYQGLLMGLLLGVPAGLLLLGAAGSLVQGKLWISLAEPTLRLVHTLLGLVYSDLVYQPENFLIGISAFQVEIFGACSGYEGIILITVFLTIYFWLFRKELRFPQVLWLFPIGIMAIWLANAMRIATLIVIGASFSPEIAVKGFHSQAGWIAFTLIALGLVTLSHRMRFFTVTKANSAVTRNSAIAAALLFPLLVLLAVSMMTAAFSAGFEALYPLPVVAAAAALWYYRKAYGALGWSWSWQAAGIGGAVFLLWLTLEPNVDSRKTELARGLAELSAWSATVWLTFRVLGSVIVVPLVEELAFRGYLLRKLIAQDFENVRLGQFTWLSFIMSSVLFGLLHGRWLAGTLAGMAYALAVYRRGQLGDAVLAHITTNALIAICVLVQGRWALWS